MIELLFDNNARAKIAHGEWWATEPRLERYLNVYFHPVMPGAAPAEGELGASAARAAASALGAMLRIQSPPGMVVNLDGDVAGFLPVANVATGVNCGTGAGGFKPGNKCAKSKSLPVADYPPDPEFFSSNPVSVQANKDAIAEMKVLAEAGSLSDLEAHPGTLSPKVQDYKSQLVAKLKAHHAKGTNVPDGFPPHPDDLVFVAKLGGYSGAVKMQDPTTGEFYVRKKGVNPGHIRNEFATEQAYKAAGLNVPDSHLYETDDGPVKLSKFIEATEYGKLDPHAKELAKKEIQKGFAVDAVLGNWDVIGSKNDNVMVDKDGKVWRIDVGGGMEYSGAGTLKGAAFGKDVQEFHSLKNAALNKNTAAVFGDMTEADTKSSALGMLLNKQTLIDSVPDHLKDTIEARIEHFAIQAGVSPTLAKAKLSTATTVAAGFSSGVTSAVLTPSLPAASKLGAAHGLVDHVKANIAGTKFTQEHLDKIGFMNPNGVVDGVFYMPFMKGPKGTDYNSDNSAHLAKILPPGTKIKAVKVRTHQVNNPDLEFVGGKVVKKKAGATKAGKPKLPFALQPHQQDSNPTVKIASLKPQESLPKEFSSWHTKGASKLTADEHEAISDWKGSAKSIRNAIASDPPPPPKGTTPEAKKGRDFFNALLKAPKVEGTVYRGIHDESHTSNFYATEQLQKVKLAGVGGYWDDTAPMCMSRDPKESKKFSSPDSGVMFKIQTKTGRSIEEQGYSHLYEREVVGMPNVKYRITAIHENISGVLKSTYGAAHLIEMEEVLE